MRSGRWTLLVIAGVFLAGTLTGATIVGFGRSAPTSKRAAAPAADAAPGPGGADRPAPADLPAGQGPQRPVGMAIEIPSIGVKSDLIDLHIQADGTLGVPQDFGVAGLWTEGSAPGAPGPAIVVGHVDSVNGPAVFYRLRDLRPGDTVLVRKKDGSALTYAVERMGQYAKDRFPTDLVYGATPTSTLRLVTCGGAFDRTRREYTDNVVVFAHLVT